MTATHHEAMGGTAMGTALSMRKGMSVMGSKS